MVACAVSLLRSATAPQVKLRVYYQHVPEMYNIFNSKVKLWNLYMVNTFPGIRTRILPYLMQKKSSQTINTDLMQKLGKKLKSFF